MFYIHFYHIGVLLVKWSDFEVPGSPKPVVNFTHLPFCGKNLTTGQSLVYRYGQVTLSKQRDTISAKNDFETVRIVRAKNLKIFEEILIEVGTRLRYLLHGFMYLRYLTNEILFIGKTALWKKTSFHTIITDFVSDPYQTTEAFN